MTTPSSLRKLLPENCFCHSVLVLPKEYALSPQELALTGKMFPKRLNDFKRGRYCANFTLNQLGFHGFPVLIGSNREPIWPSKVIGSISHCENFCFAVAANTDKLLGIGIDVEIASKLDEDSIPHICSPTEIKSLSNYADVLLGCKIVFSIKESIFKCLYPLYQQWIDFLDVEIELLADNRYSIKLINPLLSAFVTELLDGRWMIDDDLILSSCWYNPSALGTSSDKY